MQTWPVDTHFLWRSVVGKVKKRPLRSWLTTKIVFIYLLLIMLASLVLIYSMIPLRKAEDFSLPMGKSESRSWTVFVPSKSVSCKIPPLDPFESTILETMRPRNPDAWKVNCRPRKVFSRGQNWTLIQHGGFLRLNCCYREVKPDPQPDPASYSKIFTYRHIDPTLLPWFSPVCVPITGKTTDLPPSMEFVSIECTRRGLTGSENETLPESNNNNLHVNHSAIIFRDLFAFVPPKGHLTSSKARRKSKKKVLENNRPPSVLVLGLDQLSLGHFIRHMPQSYEFLMRNFHVRPMFGYNKVDDTTLPNVAAVLTGRTLEELTQSCWNHSFLSFFDECPFIWKNFSQKGFLTSYAEDKLPYSIFYNKLYARRGFLFQPTDYFYNFLGMQMHQLVKSPPMCVNDRLELTSLLDYVEDTMTSLKNVPFFQFAWASSLTTKYYNYAPNGDQPLHKFFEALVDKRLLNDTIIFLISDHGFRFSPLIELRQGRFESKMPLFLAIFPQWFARRYESAIKNFEQNSLRLTTPFDTFETLLDLLNPEKSLREETIKLREEELDTKKSRGISLFLPIPLNRTCAMAEIGPKSCICRDSRPIKFFDRSEIVGKFAGKIVDEINSYLEQFKKICASLKLNPGFRSKLSGIIPEGDARLTDYYRNPKDLTGWKKSMSQGFNTKEFFLLEESIPGHFRDVKRPRLLEMRTSGGNFSEALLTIQTVPGLGIFEGRLQLQGRKWVVQEVLRLNEYDLQSHCVSLYKLKSFCYCRRQILV